MVAILFRASKIKNNGAKTKDDLPGYEKRPSFPTASFYITIEKLLA